MIGQTIAHYRITQELGRGGMGIVYKAEDTKLKRDVALKFLPPHAKEAEEERARFIQEAQAAAALNHPNICTIYGIEEVEGREFIEMELVDGSTLREKLPLGNINEAIAYSIQIAEALQEAHSKGIVHRDIKAENIMVNSRNQIKVMDFGLAKLKGTVRLTKTSSTVGTLAYMSPEQISGGDVDARADLFSFGVLIFEMLTGRMPFRGEHEAATVYSIMNEDPELLTKHLPEASPALVVFLGKALEKDPAERYQSAAEMLVDLKRMRKASSHPSRQYPVQQQSSGLRPATPPVPGPSRKSKIALLTGGLIVIVACAVILLQRDERVVPSVNNVRMTRLTTSGDAGYSAVSPDGKYVVYVKGEPGAWGLWIRQVASSTDVMVIPPSDISIQGSAFSNDGNYLFYTASLPESPTPAIYRIPVLGGAPPRKIVSNVAESATLSPDDDRIAFFRPFPATGEEALFIARADGSEERKLISRDGKELFYLSSGGAPAWSPDGTLIACPAGSTIGGFSVGIVVIPVDEPRDVIITTESWGDVGRIAWYGDGSGLVFCARKKGEPGQIYFLSYPDGELSRVTNDLYEYGPTSLSVTRDGKSIVSAQGQTYSSISVIRNRDPDTPVEITKGATRTDGQGGLTWTQDNRILYTAYSGTAHDLWASRPDGSETRQITFEEGYERSPVANLATGEIYYVTAGEDLPNVWKIGSRGENPVRVTKSEDYNPAISRDGKWLVFDSWKSGARALWKMELGRGDTATLLRSGATSPKISPDGKLVACLFHDEAELRERIAVVSLSDGRLASVFDLPLTATRDVFAWAPDGKSIHYIDTRSRISNIWAYDYRTGTASQVTSFRSDRIFNFAWSPDGTMLAVARGQTTSDIVMLTMTE